ncbi:MAG: phosphoribosyltransferase family protein [Actinomycetota bacterium]|nr:phosphoribosyltransferase family protein [Actinomycetota bacterium]
MMFVDRVDAGRRLAARLEHLRSEPLVVLGLPRGGVPVACQVAVELGAPLDVIVVRKLGVPFHPELGMGAIGEGGIRVLNDEVIRAAGVSDRELEAVEARERAELERRARRFRKDRTPVPLAGRTAVIIDDGIATGSTARSACQVARAHGAARVVLAVPVAPAGWERRFADVADELVCLVAPETFFAIGQFYEDFSQTTDEEVLDCLERAGPSTPATAVPQAGHAGLGGTGGPPDAPSGDDPSDGGPRGDPPGNDPPRGDPPRGDPPGAPFVRDEDVDVEAGPVLLGGRLTVPEHAIGIVAFAHGSGSSRHSPRNRYVASVLNEAAIGTLLFDLLTSDEETDRANVFDIPLLARRLSDATGWLRAQPVSAGLPVGYFGASTGAGAALWAAARRDADVAAVVSRGGRPDLARLRLPDVTAPTLLVVGALDDVVLELNREAQALLRCESKLVVVPGASHLFEEPGTLQAAAVAARDWFTTHFSASTYRTG